MNHLFYETWKSNKTWTKQMVQASVLFTKKASVLTSTTVCSAKHLFYNIALFFPKAAAPFNIWEGNGASNEALHAWRAVTKTFWFLTFIELIFKSINLIEKIFIGIVKTVIMNEKLYHNKVKYIFVIPCQILTIINCVCYT